MSEFWRTPTWQVISPGLSGRIIACENGDLTEDEVVALFQDLIDSGLVWQLQGRYGRTATALIEAGLVEFDWRQAIDQ